jgi:integrase
VDEEIALLRDLRRHQAALRLQAGAAWQDRGSVFTDDYGRSLDQCRLRRSSTRCFELPSCPKVNLYSLRRTMASVMHALGVPPKVIATRMGHADTQVLFKHYIREFEAQDAAAAESMAAAIREARRIGHRDAEADC